MQKKIVLQADLAKWTDSASHGALLRFLERLQTAVVGVTNDAPVPGSKTIDSLLQILQQVERLVQAHPVVKDADVSRFGKPEFREFYDDLHARAPAWMAGLCLPETQRYAPEMLAYFAESWGNRTRIDYGSGHELNFVLFLYTLHETGILVEADYTAAIVKVFTQYMAIMRQLQKTYWLEPAGSHGVWGLDDYHFLPFLFGAAQLKTHPHMKPKLIHNKELVESLWRQYMYLECIQFINDIKTVPGVDKASASLRWHSPMLDDISLARLWAKISDGMIKMYRAEVLGKLPIVQHIMFGELFPAPDGLTGHAENVEDDCGHVHPKQGINTWGDCCGIKIPSAVAASQANQRVPFD
ncbi:Phosphotyrosyl phosphatase activator [Metschnikowia bicuspidata var. bicuspidata NRRL YB-4993]|uniref:Serine/threonine-protein phosphatase 2A activator n=1 Tax=Metschnikowia bicuspidata var. bicuspidata NRRL YB-4993 TaxID=869754 RepID=A0A1A0HA44_9ASCO|nr:Phosphotyrosyl phosphatase activator [Metschnikowia bicuspidata var. bicuspidata NRRL YB-4993]OBA20747.1 Phosphotyrosyl phosphatase activator [Metschnikowia bicuspidata var. bicuspidata NRRL YB-4993]